MPPSRDERNEPGYARCCQMPGSRRAWNTANTTMRRDSGRKDRVWKTARPDTANITVHDGKALRILCSQVNSPVDLRYELDTQSSATLLIPQCRFIEFAARGAPEDDRKGHLLKRSAIEALTSSQATTSSGLASCHNVTLCKAQ
jgi:hypothetical protein